MEEMAQRAEREGRTLDPAKMSTEERDELRDKGYGGLWSVGKAAEEPPALVVLSHFPESRQPAQATDKTVCLVGKGQRSPNTEVLPPESYPSFAWLLTAATGCCRDSLPPLLMHRSS